MKVPRVSVRVLETKSAFAEVHLTGNAGIHHPLQRPVYGGAADAMVFALDDVDQIVGAQVSLLPEEHVDDLVAFAGTLRAGGAQSIDVRKGYSHWTFAPARGSRQTTR
jgi:hypothetical protein